MGLVRHKREEQQNKDSSERSGHTHGTPNCSFLQEHRELDRKWFEKGKGLEEKDDEGLYKPG
jgi:hypothetical protein